MKAIQTVAFLAGFLIAMLASSEEGKVLYNSTSLFAVKSQSKATATTVPPTPSVVSVATANSSNVKKPRVVIGGAGSHFASSLPSIKASIRDVLKDFDLAGIIIFEYNSKDTTLSELRGGWTTEFGQDKVHILSGLPDPNMTDPILYARNMVMTKIKELSNVTVVDNVLLLDMSATVGHLSGVKYCLSLPEKWGACCANQYNLYFDLYSLLTYDKWLPCYFYECPGGQSFKRGAFKHIPASTPPISVQSCFGGATLYNWKQVLEPLEKVDLFLSHDETGAKVSNEFISFHRHVRVALGGNFSVYIQPKMLNDGRLGTRKAVNNHNRPLWEASWNDPTMKEYYDHRIG
jgi:hypothetical protein